MPAFRSLLNAQNPNNYGASAIPVDFREGRADAEQQMDMIEKEIDQLAKKRQAGQFGRQDLRRFKALNQMYNDLVKTYHKSKDASEALDTDLELSSREGLVGGTKNKLMRGVGERPEVQ